MFDLSLIELLFIAVVALVVIGPKDLPKALGHGLRLFKQLRDAMGDLRAQVDEVVEASGAREVKDDIQTIIDENGEIQQVYDISDFLDDAPPTRHPQRSEGSQEAAQDASPSAQHDAEKL
jgi:sec-independent protein translocase protein TatB